MKITLLFALLLLIAPAVSAQKMTNPLPVQIDFFNQLRFTDLPLVEENPRSPLKGNIKSIQETNYNNSVKNETIQKGNSNHTTVSTFDMAGFRQKVVSQVAKKADTIDIDYYDTDGYLNKIHSIFPPNDLLIQYDNNHRIQKETYNEVDGFDATFSYNDNGSLKEITVFSTGKGKLKRRWVYSYTATGYSIHEYSYRLDKVENSAVFTFRDGYLSQLISFTETNKKDEVIRFDGKGNIVEEDDYSGGEKLVTKTNYRYLKFDVQGNWLARTKYESISARSVNSEMDGDLQIRTIQYWK